MVANNPTPTTGNVAKMTYILRTLVTLIFSCVRQSSYIWSDHILGKHLTTHTVLVGCLTCKSMSICDQITFMSKSLTTYYTCMISLVCFLMSNHINLLGTSFIKYITFLGFFSFMSLFMFHQITLFCFKQYSL